MKEKKIIFQLYFLSITLFSFYSIFSVNSDNFNDVVSAGLVPGLKNFLVILGLNPNVNQLSVLAKDSNEGLSCVVDVPAVCKKIHVYGMLAQSKGHI